MKRWNRSYHNYIDDSLLLIQNWTALTQFEHADSSGSLNLKRRIENLLRARGKRRRRETQRLDMRINDDDRAISWARCVHTYTCETRDVKAQLRTLDRLELKHVILHPCYRGRSLHLWKLQRSIIHVFESSVFPVKNRFIRPLPRACHNTHIRTHTTVLHSRRYVNH